MARLLFYLDDYSHDPWRKAFAATAGDIAFHGHPDWPDDDGTPTYALVWHPPHGLLASLPRLDAIFSLGAGVDHLLDDPDLPDVPIIRMGDSGLRQGMAEYVLLQVLFHQRKMPAILAQQQAHRFERVFSPVAQECTVGLMGLGALGQSVAAALQPLGYGLRAWTRTGKRAMNGLDHFHGADQLGTFLAGCTMVVGLLPDTPQTTHLLNAETLDQLPRGAVVINAGRGNLVDLDALLARLESGALGGASLDVFPSEPLPADHPAWTAPNLVVTPHSAAITRPDTAARFVTETIAQLQHGETPPTLLDRGRGY
ncbi:2-hydroxyacid dehydrogenase [Yunchengibacter salinarum]|uniref:2-hydroxyacid dehydrogenase n=1 Tax=Yunchengibacter salinarum TaxID=3133399 RepID=UPI0035B61A7E